MPLLVLLVAVLVALGVGRAVWMGSSEERPATRSDEATVLLAGARYRVSDQDRDGRADCLVRPGLGAVLARVGVGGAHWAGEGAERCGRGQATRMSAELQAALTELLELQWKNELGHLAAVDDDGDGRVDCLIQVHGAGVVARRTPGSCASRDAGEIRQSADVSWPAVDRLGELQRTVAELLGLDEG